MKIAVIGTGYVGLVTGACLSEMGYEVTCVDNHEGKIAALKRGELPIHEPGLDAIVVRGYAEGRLRFDTRLASVMGVADVYIVAVGTPPNEDGSADLNHVLGVARELGRGLNRYATIVTKSTVPVGTADKVRAVIQAELDDRGASLEFDIVSNPEFLKEGDAVNDFMRPDRIVIGVDSDRARATMRDLYAPFNRNHERTIFMGIREAEMTKYAANAMLATRISFMNEIANLCERMNVDVEMVRVGIGSDPRIGYSFLYAGCGYGGSCFPKDVKALIRMAQDADFSPVILKAVETRNELQKKRMFEKVLARFGQDLRGRIFAMWGLAFKPGTDDMREAPATVLIEALLSAGATVRAYDPVAMDAALRTFPQKWFGEERLVLATGAYESVEGADALLLVTEWKQFRHPDFSRLARLLRQKIIFDGRNQYDVAILRRAEFEYFGIGR